MLESERYQLDPEEESLRDWVWTLRELFEEISQTLTLLREEIASIQPILKAQRDASCQ